MSNRLTVCCDRCREEIPATKGFHLSANAWIGAINFKPGDFCISCLAEMCGERLTTSEIVRRVDAWDDAKYQEIDEERSKNRDW